MLGGTRAAFSLRLILLYYRGKTFLSTPPNTPRIMGSLSGWWEQELFPTCTIPGTVPLHAFRCFPPASVCFPTQDLIATQLKDRRGPLPTGRACVQLSPLEPTLQTLAAVVFWGRLCFLHSERGVGSSWSPSPCHNLEALLALSWGTPRLTAFPSQSRPFIAPSPVSWQPCNIRPQVLSCFRWEDKSVPVIHSHWKTKSPLYICISLIPLTWSFSKSKSHIVNRVKNHFKISD